MAIAQTIQELTGNQYSELMYYQVPDTEDAKEAPDTENIKGDFILQVRQMLSKCDITAIGSGDTYDLDLEHAVQAFQNKMQMTPTGILDNRTWQSMILYSSKYSDAVEDSTLEAAIEAGEVSDSPHFNSFFGTSNMKTHRRNNKDIKIVFGNNTVVKTIKNVFMRSVSVEVDTSGNPISETYEFIAQDIIESDEIMDSNKYLAGEPEHASDIGYDFSTVGL